MFLIRRSSKYKQSVQCFVRRFSHDTHRKYEFVKRTSKYSTNQARPTLFGDVASPPVRAVMMTASMLHFDYQFHEIDLFCSEHKTEFYTKINPLQKVPALAIGDKIITDSHAIVMFLSRKSKNDLLYPEKSLTRAQVDQMLYFNAGELFPVDSAIYSEYFTGKWPADEKKVAEWYRLLDYLELRLKKHPYLAGDRVLLCDLCCAATLSSLSLLLPCLDHHVNVKQWLERLKELPCFEINDRGLKRLNVFVEKIKTIL